MSCSGRRWSCRRLPREPPFSVSRGPFLQPNQENQFVLPVMALVEASAGAIAAEIGLDEVLAGTAKRRSRTVRSHP